MEWVNQNLCNTRAMLWQGMIRLNIGWSKSGNQAPEEPSTRQEDWILRRCQAVGGCCR